MTLKLSKNNLLRAVLIGISITLLCIQGCKKSEQPPAPATPAKAAASPPIVKQPEKPIQKQLSSSSPLKAAPVNQFDFSSKRDPFKPYVTMKKAAAPVRTRTKKISTFALPINNYDVNQFKLIGIISGGRETRAMITDPAGKGYVIKAGMIIGKNDGRVMSITSGGVDVLEQFTDDNGKTRKEYIRINLPRKQ